MKDISMIGLTKDKYKVYVCGGDSCKTPHFHCERSKFDASLNMTAGEYLFHDNSLDVLTTSEIDNLREFLKSKDSREPNKTKWDIIVSEWNRMNPRYTMDIKSYIPNYSYLGNL